MAKITLTILLLFTIVHLIAQKTLSGIYVTNFPTYGVFSKTITLHCDSTAVLNFRGDLMNDNSYGYWKVKDDSLTIYFDTSKPDARFKDTLHLKIKKNKLYPAAWTKDFYHKLKTVINRYNEETGGSMKVPSFREIQKQQTRTPKNFKGKTGKQFFRRQKKYVCDK